MSIIYIVVVFFLSEVYLSALLFHGLIKLWLPWMRHSFLFMAHKRIELYKRWEEISKDKVLAANILAGRIPLYPEGPRLFYDTIKKERGIYVLKKGIVSDATKFVTIHSVHFFLSSSKIFF
jgi:hypothetical protein